MYICVRIRVMSFSVLCFSLFFFFKQKTAYEMRISDWSSDVCSSDLLLTQLRASDFHVFTRLEVEQVCAAAGWTVRSDGAVALPGTDRKSVVEGKRVSVRVDLGGRRIIKKKKQTKTNSKRRQYNNAKINRHINRKL